MRAIDADHLKRWILSRVFKTQLSVADVIDQIDREDTIEPEIVRCKDCKFYYNSNESCQLIDTRLKFYETNKTWVNDCFCSWAERRTDERDIPIEIRSFF